MNAALYDIIIIIWLHYLDLDMVVNGDE